MIKVKFLIFICLIGILTACNSLYYSLRTKPELFDNRNVKIPVGYNLIFEDNFNDTINPIWKKSMYWSPPIFNESFPGSGYYASENVIESDSSIQLWTKVMPRKFFNHLTGDSVMIEQSIGVIDLYNFVYDISLDKEYAIFCRTKMPDNLQQWPAFWTYSLEGSQEIDIFEYWNVDEFTTNIHINGRMYLKYHKITDPNGYHIYGIQVIPDMVRFSFDGYIFREVKVNIFQKMTVILNNGVTPYAPTCLNIDWFKLYKK